MRELPGKSPKNFRGSPGNFRGSPGNFPEARGSLTPSQRLAKFISNWPSGKELLGGRFGYFFIFPARGRGRGFEAPERG